MSTIICSGIHHPKLTQEFINGLKFTRLQKKCQDEKILTVPTQNYSAYSACHILHFLSDRMGSNGTVDQLVFIAFSAGVVGAIGAAWGWQQRGGTVKALIALDGWGVPLYGNFPLYRLSHDRFTHWSSAWLGSGEESFYADPAVSHLDLWQSPQTTLGWSLNATNSSRERLSAAQFISQLLQRHGEWQ